MLINDGRIIVPIVRIGVWKISSQHHWAQLWVRWRIWCFIRIKTSVMCKPTTCYLNNHFLPLHTMQLFLFNTQSPWSLCQPTIIFTIIFITLQLVEPRILSYLCMVLQAYSSFQEFWAFNGNCQKVKAGRLVGLADCCAARVLADNATF